MVVTYEGNAIVYCEGAFGTTNGKTAHGLVRRSQRYRVLGIIDSSLAGNDAGEVLDGKPCGVPIVADLQEALDYISKVRLPPATHWVMGLAPDGGGLSSAVRKDIIAAIRTKLSVVSGLHTFVSEDPEIVRLAKRNHVDIMDVRKPPPRHTLHFFSGQIERVRALRVAVLGTDSAVGKRTTAWMIVDGLRNQKIPAELVGTGQTAWMQGARYGVIFDSLINDFVTGEIEHAIVRCDKEEKPRVIVIEGQGSLMNPAYPGGLEILAAGRPQLIVLQHAPTRAFYDGFENYPIHPLNQQIQAIELLSGRKVFAITINRHGIAPEDIPKTCKAVKEESGLPTYEVLSNGPEHLVSHISRFLTSQHSCPKQVL